MNEGQPVRPANILNIVAINQGKLPLTMDEPAAPGLSPDRFAELRTAGHMVVDTRSSAAFGSGHITGALNINLASAEFEQRVGWVTPDDVPLLLVMESDADLVRALRALAFIGLDSRVVGYLQGGMKAWIRDGRQVTTVHQISVHQLSEHLHNGVDMRVLDVREDAEWDEGHIDGAHSKSLRQLRGQTGELGLEPADHVSVVCAVGVRSSTASSILLADGFEHVYNVTGGMRAWNAAGLPTVGE